jgi:molybdate transport system substrate-binding protein
MLSSRRRKSIGSLLLVCVVSIILAIGCTPSTRSPTLLVAAAASLQPALQEITTLADRSIANVRVKYNFGSSGALQQQIAQGAPIDIFISAANRQMQALQQQNLLVLNTHKNLLTNQLVLIVPKTSALKLTDFRQLTQVRIQRIAIGEPRSVPAGQYATETFTRLEIVDRLRSKLILANNVRAVLASVETGNADAGVVYISDVRSSDRVTIAAIADPQLHSPIIYPMAIIRSSKSIDAAKKYLEFLQTQPVRAVFKKYGFGIAAS